MQTICIITGCLILAYLVWYEVSKSHRELMKARAREIELRDSLFKAKLIKAVEDYRQHYKNAYDHCRKMEADGIIVFGPFYDGHFSFASRQLLKAEVALINYQYDDVPQAIEEGERYVRLALSDALCTDLMKQFEAALGQK
jgi:hypothetical protein